MGGASSYLAHAVAGCAVGAARSSGGSGCSSGAIGAVIGEAAAIAYNAGRDMLTQGLSPDTVQFAGMFGGIAAALAGGDPNIGAAAAGNAAANNFSSAVARGVAACLEISLCRNGVLTAAMAAAISGEIERTRAANPGMSDRAVEAMAVSSVLAQATANGIGSVYGWFTSTPATPLPPTPPMITPAEAQRVYGAPPLQNPEELRAWLGQTLQGYPADEAQKWAQDLIRTLPASEQVHYSDLIVQQVHHICTDKNCISPNAGGPWTPEFQKMFDKADLSMQDELNKVWVAGHQGPHPQEYHSLIYDRLKDLDALPADAYQQAFRNELKRIGQEIQTSGTRLNKLVTKK